MKIIIIDIGQFHDRIFHYENNIYLERQTLYLIGPLTLFDIDKHHLTPLTEFCMGGLRPRSAVLSHGITRNVVYDLFVHVLTTIWCICSSGIMVC